MRIPIVLILLMTCVLAQEAYKFGVFPHMPLFRLHKMYAPVAEDFEKYMDKPVNLMTRPYFKLYKEELNRGLYDIALVQPFDYIQAHEKQGYIPLVRRAQNLEAIMVVKENSKFNSIDDIKKGIIASAPASAAVTQMMIKELTTKGYRVGGEFTISYSKNHFICMQKVLNEKAVACITAKRTLQIFTKDKGKKMFKIIYTTQSLPHVLFVVHPRVPKQVIKTLKHHLVNWKNESDFKFNHENFIEAHDKDYDVVRNFIKE